MLAAYVKKGSALMLVLLLAAFLISGPTLAQTNNDQEAKAAQEKASPEDKAQALITSKKRFSNVSYALDGEYVFTRLSGRGEDCKTGTDIVAFDLRQAPPKKIILL